MNKRKQFRSEDELSESGCKIKREKTEPAECPGIAATNRKEQVQMPIPLPMFSAAADDKQNAPAHQGIEIAVKDVESLPAPPMDASSLRDLAKWDEIAAAVEARSEEEVDIQTSLNFIPKSEAPENAYYDDLRDLNIGFTRSRNALAKFHIEGLSCYTQTTSIADGLDELGIPHKDVFTGRRVYNTPPCFFVIAPKNWEEHLSRVTWLCGHQVQIGVTESRRQPEPAAAECPGIAATNRKAGEEWDKEQVKKPIPLPWISAKDEGTEKGRSRGSLANPESGVPTAMLTSTTATISSCQSASQSAHRDVEWFILKGPPTNTELSSIACELEALGIVPDKVFRARSGSNILDFFVAKVLRSQGTALLQVKSLCGEEVRIIRMGSANSPDPLTTNRPDPSSSSATPSTSPTEPQSPPRDVSAEKFIVEGLLPTTDLASINDGLQNLGMSPDRVYISSFGDGLNFFMAVVPSRHARDLIQVTRLCEQDVRITSLGWIRDLNPRLAAGVRASWLQRSSAASLSPKP